MSKKIFIVGAGEWQVPMILKAKDLGLEVMAIDMNPNAPGLQIADCAEVINTRELEAALMFAKKQNINGVTTMASDHGVPTVAYLTEKLSLVGMNYENAVTCTNKIAVRRKLPKKLSPKYFSVNSYNHDIKNTKLDFPAVVKPADSCGSKGVEKVENRPDLMNAIQNAMERSSSGDILIEEWMEGPEVSVEGLVYSGNICLVAITDKIVSKPPYCVETGHTIPSFLDETVQDQIKQTVILATKAVGLDNCGFHIEIKITEKGPKIIEIGARLGGGTIASHLVPLANGIDLVGECIKMTLGKIPKLKQKINRSSAVRFLTPPPGLVNSVSDYTQILKNTGIKKIKVDVKRRDIISPFRSSDDRIGYVVSSCKTREEAVKLAEWARDNIIIRVN